MESERSSVSKMVKSKRTIRKIKTKISTKKKINKNSSSQSRVSSKLKSKLKANTRQQSKSTKSSKLEKSKCRARPSMSVNSSKSRKSTISKKVLKRTSNVSKKINNKRNPIVKVKSLKSRSNKPKYKMTPPILNEVEDDSGRQQTGEVEYELEESATDQIQKKNKDSDDDGEEDTETGECEENNESEFTKPTINQIRKDKKETTISYSEKINDKEFEQMYDELNELNSGMKTLKHSYGSIIKSLCAIQNRRTKKKIQREMQKREGKLSFLATLSTCDVADLKSRSCLEQSEKYDIERFINPMTREETFNALFDEIEEVRKCTEHLRINFFDPRGRFLRDKYDEQEEYRLNRSKFNEIRLWIKKLATVVDEIVRNYNDDLLNLFRL